MFYHFYLVVIKFSEGKTTTFYIFLLYYIPLFQNYSPSKFCKKLKVSRQAIRTSKIISFCYRFFQNATSNVSVLELSYKLVMTCTQIQKNRTNT